MGLAMRWCMILLVVVGLCSAQYDEPVCEDLLEGARLGLGTMVKLLLGKETLQMEYQQSRDDLQRQIHVTLVNLLQLLADVPDAHSYDSPYATLPLSFYPNPLSTPLPSRPPITPSSYRPPPLHPTGLPPPLHPTGLPPPHHLTSHPPPLHPTGLALLPRTPKQPLAPLSTRSPPPATDLSTSATALPPRTQSRHPKNCRDTS